MRNNRILKVSIIAAIMMIMLLCLTNNVFAADNARVFSTNFFSTRDSDRTHAVHGFNKLGYNVSTENTSTRSRIFSWTNSGGSNYSNNNYAFYISTHGPDDPDAANGVTYFLDTNENEITPGEISGNWHLVYIDACNSKRNNKFPNSLNITGRSQRAYLGWATVVGVVEANEFNNYFWETYVTHYTIQQAAVKAAADVPGSGTTPIRFSGDSSWYGAGR